MKNRNDEYFNRPYSRKEMIEAARLQMILHDDTEQCKMHGFCVTIIATIFTIVAFAISFYIMANQGVINKLAIIIFMTFLLMEIYTLIHTWKYRPSAVYRRAFHEYRFGKNLSAMKFTGNQNCEL